MPPSVPDSERDGRDGSDGRDGRDGRDGAASAVNLEVRCIEDARELEALVPAWRDLLARMEQPEPVMTPLWVRSWWNAFGDTDGRQLKVVAVWNGARLDGLAPLVARTVRHRGLLPFRRLELVGTGEDERDEVCSDYAGVLAAKGAEARVASALATELRADTEGWDDLLLPHMNAESAMVPALEAAFTSDGMTAECKPSGLCAYAALPGTFDAYVKSLDSKSRYLVTRSRRELDKWAGEEGWKLHRASTPAELEVGRKVLHALHAERWRSEGHEGVFVRDRFRRFHDEVMPELLREVDGELDLLWLTVGTRPVAALYNILYANKVYVYQTGRTDDVPKTLRIGIAINALAIERYIERGFREYDFLNGLSQYKRQLSAGTTRPLVTLRAVGPSVRARALDAARRAGEKLVDHARDLRDKYRENTRDVSAAAAPPPASDE